MTTVITHQRVCIYGIQQRKVIHFNSLHVSITIDIALKKMRRHFQEENVVNVMKDGVELSVMFRYVNSVFMEPVLMKTHVYVILSMKEQDVLNLYVRIVFMEYA